MDWNTTLFDYSVLSHARKAEIANCILGDHRYGHHSTALTHTVKFHQPGVNNPDKLIKLCTTLLIKSPTEVKRGVGGLWEKEADPA